MNLKERLLSRKFWAWVVWTIITIIALLNDKLAPEIKTTIFYWYGVITAVWIGAQSLIEGIQNKTKGQG